MKKTLLIDLDGTLLGAHSVKLHWYFIRAFVRSLREMGFGFFHSLFILHRLKLSVRDSVHQNNGVCNWDKAVAFFSQLTQLPEKEARSKLTAMSKSCFLYASPSLYPLPEAQKFIEWSKNHYRLILATNPLWPYEVVEFRLGIAGIHPSQFEFITHAENMSSCKPNVDYYQELQKKLNLNPIECLMIGNDEKKDGPARNIGVQVVIIRTPSDFILLEKKLTLELQGTATKWITANLSN